MTGLFVTGTDTGVGKTLVAATLLHAFAQRGMRTLAMKPVASGCSMIRGKLRNDDALALMAAMTAQATYDQVNPVALEPSVAPHLAAQTAGVVIDVPGLVVQARELEQRADILVVEGAGGWRVPLGPSSSLADFARLLGFPVVLVVSVRLGCINHTLLTAEAIQADGLRLAGWVANCFEPDVERVDEQITSLHERLAAPCIGVLGAMSTPEPAELARHLDLALLLEKDVDICP